MKKYPNIGYFFLLILIVLGELFIFEISFKESLSNELFWGIGLSISLFLTLINDLLFIRRDDINFGDFSLFKLILGILFLLFVFSLIFSEMARTLGMNLSFFFISTSLVFLWRFFRSIGEMQRFFENNFKKKREVKNLLLLIVISFLSFNSFNCSQEGNGKKVKFYYNFYKGPFEIRKMFSEKGPSGNIVGGFFLFSGGFSGEFSTQTFCQFSWKTKRGYYVTSTVPFSSIKIEIDESLETPQLFIKPHNLVYTYIDPLPDYKDEFKNPGEVNSHINYVLIKCSSNHWIVDVNLPMNRE